MGTVTTRPAPGWWANLLTLDCSACGASWTIDLNDAPFTTAAFINRQAWQHERDCMSAPARNDR